MASQLRPTQLFVCSLCHQTFGRQSDANRHYNSQHNLLLDAVCPICYGTCISGARIDRQVAHMRKYHPEAPDRQQWIPEWMTSSAVSSLTSRTPLSVPDENGVYHRSSLAAIEAPPADPANSSNGYLSNEGDSNLAESATVTNAGNSTPANGAVSTLNSPDTAPRDMVDGHWAGGDGSGEDETGGNGAGGNGAGGEVTEDPNEPL